MNDKVTNDVDGRQCSENITTVAAASVPARIPWREPKLSFVEPVLTKQGDLTEITGQGIFGTFIPR
jgi:hypothetical protein